MPWIFETKGNQSAILDPKVVFPVIYHGRVKHDKGGEKSFTLIFLFAYRCIDLAAPLVVDVGSSPLPIGTTVASHYIFFDPGLAQSMIGTVAFDADVLAILTSITNLFNSDFLANTGVNYFNPSLRGLETGDSVTISGPRQILFDTTASTPGDYVRALTAFSPTAVPEPATMLLLSSGLVGLAGYGRRKLFKK